MSSDKYTRVTLESNPGKLSFPIKPTEDPIVNDVIRSLMRRSNQGMITYGTSMKENPLSTEEWIDNAIEEALDLACYLTRLKDEL